MYYILHFDVRNVSSMQVLIHLLSLHQLTGGLSWRWANKPLNTFTDIYWHFVQQYLIVLLSG